MNKKHFVAMAIILILVIWIATSSSQAMGDENTGVAPSITASQWYVTPLGDDGNDCMSPTTSCGSINAAFNKPGFVEGDTVYVSTGIYTSTTGSEVVSINKNVTLSGGWDTTFIIQQGVSTVDGENARGGIAVTSGNVSIMRFAAQNGYGPGLYNNGILTIEDCLIQNNNPRGVHNDWGGEITLIKCNVRGNSVDDQGGGIWNSGKMTLIRSAVQGNTATSWGAGIHHIGEKLILINSTISDNSGEGAAGISVMPWSSTYVRFYNSTIIHNTSTKWDVGGMFVNAGDVLIQNSIIAENYAGAGYAQDCSGTIESGGYNLIGDTTGCTFNASTGDLLNISPQAQKVWNYYALLAGSPAIDAGNPEGCTDDNGNPIIIDQRGALRPLDGDNNGTPRCDIGAYEFDPNTKQIFLPITTRPCYPIFSDNFSNPSSGWPVFDNGSTLYEYNNGEYRILLRNAQWWAGARPGYQAADYQISVDLRNPDDRFASYGIIYGLSSDWSQFYTLEIYPDGWFGIYRYDSSYYYILAEGYTAALYQHTATNHIKVVRSGSTITAYANNQRLITVTDSTYTGSRYIGLVAFSYDDSNIDIRFDNYLVYPSQCKGYNAEQTPSNDQVAFTGPRFMSPGVSGTGQLKHQP